MERAGTVEKWCQEVISRLGLSPPVTIESLIAAAGRLTEREIVLVGVRGTRVVCGMTVPYPDRDVIIYDADASHVEQMVTVAHEVGHLVGEHSPTHLSRALAGYAHEIGVDELQQIALQLPDEMLSGLMTLFGNDSETGAAPRIDVPAARTPSSLAEVSTAAVQLPTWEARGHHDLEQAMDLFAKLLVATVCDPAFGRSGRPAGYGYDWEPLVAALDLRVSRTGRGR